MNNPTKIASELVQEIMDETSKLNDVDYIECLEDIVSQLEDSIEVKKQEIGDD